MANNESAGKRPRVRKSAPTVRERQEAATAKAETAKPRRIRRVASSLAKPVKKLRLRDRKLVKIVSWPFRMIGRGIYWVTPKYFINSWHEVRKVVWPSRRETWRLTLAVFIFAIVFGALVAAVDKGLDQLFKELVLK